MNTADEELEVAYVEKFVITHLPTVNGKKVCIGYLRVAIEYKYSVPVIRVRLTFLPTKSALKKYHKTMTYSFDGYAKKVHDLGGTLYSYCFDNIHTLENHYKSRFNIPEE
jgi:hypothetical protein